MDICVHKHKMVWLCCGFEKRGWNDTRTDRRLRKNAVSVASIRTFPAACDISKERAVQNKTETVRLWALPPHNTPAGSKKLWSAWAWAWQHRGWSGTDIVQMTAIKRPIEHSGFIGPSFFAKKKLFVGAITLCSWRSGNQDTRPTNLIFTGIFIDAFSQKQFD
jgi:hypothetical protein